MATFHILAIDDEPHILGLLRELLSQEGYRVSTALSGEQGLACFVADPADLVLLDVDMPGMDGHETMRRLRQACDVPVVMLATHASLNDVLKDRENTPDSYISKPMDRRHLLGAIRYLLDCVGQSRT